MIKKVASSTPGNIYVSFELPSCLWADRIFLVGDFNQWNETATPMQQERDGIWRATVELPQGHRYEFRYLIDGQWMSDSHADGFAENSFGISNSIVQTTIPIEAMERIDCQIREIPMVKSWSPHVVIAPQGRERKTGNGYRVDIHPITHQQSSPVVA